MILAAQKYKAASALLYTVMLSAQNINDERIALHDKTLRGDTSHAKHKRRATLHGDDFRAKHKAASELYVVILAAQNINGAR